MTFRRRTYPEILDNMLTALIGGVAAEQHPYPPAEADSAQHFLRKSGVQTLISVFGSRGGNSFQFRKEKDIKLLENGVLQWVEGGERPDKGTVIEVNYTIDAGQAELNDIHTGSVVRTMAETMSLEMARLEAQLEAVYNAGFIDSASGASLDQVVALLGIKRKVSGHPTGDITFQRTPGAKGTITLPAGTRVITPDGNITYETTQTVTMASAQSEITVPARDLEANEGLPTDSLTVMPSPVLGIAAVTNTAATAIANRGETDTELRERAKTFLHGSERATKGSLERVLAEQGIEGDIEEFTEKAGQIRIIPHTDSLSGDQHQRLLDALRAAKPAGVEVIIGNPIQPKAVDIELALTTGKNLAEPLVQHAHRAVQDAVVAFFENVPSGEDASLNKLAVLLLSIDGVEDARPVSAVFQGENQSILDRDAGTIKLAGSPNKLGALTLVDANLPSRLDVLATFSPTADPIDTEPIRASLNALVATINASNDPSQRTLDFLKLLRNSPLPGIDMVSATAASIAPNFTITFVITQSTGVTHTLADGAPTYVLADLERLALQSVEAKEQP